MSGISSDVDTVKALKDALGAFLKCAARGVVEVYFYSVRGQCQMGLINLLMLSDRQYAALLLSTNLVSIDTLADGNLKVKCMTKQWDNFLQSYNLRYDYGEGLDLSETTTIKVSVDCYKRRKQGDKPSSTRKEILAIRVGKGKPGEKTKASLKATDGVEPPSTTFLRREQRSFEEIIKPLIKSILIEQPEKVKAVMDWVDMKDLREDISAYNNDDGDDSPPDDEPEANNSNNVDVGCTQIGTGTSDVPDDSITQERSTTVSNTGQAQSQQSKGTTASGTSDTANEPTQPSDTARQQPLDTAVGRTGTAQQQPFDTVVGHINHYPKGHPNAKYMTLNSLNNNLMDRSSTTVGLRSQNNCDGALRDIVMFKEANNEPLSFESWKGDKYCVVKIPQGTKPQDYYRTAKRLQWIEQSLQASVKDGDLGDALLCMLEYLLIRHPEATRAKLYDLGVIPRKLDEYDMAATMKAANLGIGQWREIVKCFKTFQEVDSISVSEQTWRKLGLDHGEIKTGKYLWPKKAGQRKEVVKWWTMDAADELERRLTDFANQDENFDPGKILNIYVIYAGDHGKQKFRFACKTILRMEAEDSTKKQVKKCISVYPLGDISCTKDKGIVFKNTIKDNLVAGINKVQHGKIKFEKDTSTGKWTCKIIDPDNASFNEVSDYIHVVSAFMVGDLKFYSQVLGKEDFDSYWCYLCMLNHGEWQGKRDCCGREWDLEKLKKQAEKNIEQGFTGVDRLGVRELPYFDIPVLHYIWPLLHTLIGIGNNILKYLVDFADIEIQHVPSRQIKLRQDVKTLEADLVELRELKDYFESKNENSGKEQLKVLRKELRQTLKKMDKMEDKDNMEGIEYIALDLQREELEKNIKTLEEEKAAFLARIDQYSKELTSKKKSLDDFAKARKVQEGSVYTGIDLILQEFDIMRAKYHGGDLTGVHIKILMANASEIMKKISDYLIKSKSKNCKLTPVQIKMKCKDVETILVRWDAVLSIAHKEDPTEEDFVEAQEKIDKAIELAIELGMSKTVKGHGMEAHIVKQMRMIQGGLLDFDESWMEQYHQIGSNFDIKYRNMGSEVRKATVRASTERRSTHPETIARGKQVSEQHSRGKRKKTIDKEVKAKKVKEERRASAF